MNLHVMDLKRLGSTRKYETKYRASKKTDQNCKRLECHENNNKNNDDLVTIEY